MLTNNAVSFEQPGPGYPYSMCSEPENTDTVSPLYNGTQYKCNFLRLSFTNKQKINFPLLNEMSARWRYFVYERT